MQQLRGRTILVTASGASTVTEPGRLVSSFSCGDFMLSQSGNDLSWRNVATGDSGSRPLSSGRTYGATTSTGWIEQERSTGATGAMTLTLHQIDAATGGDTVVATFSEPRRPPPSPAMPVTSTGARAAPSP